MNILYLTTEPIYPANTGSRLRSYNLIKQLANHHQLTHAYLSPTQELAEPSAQYASIWIPLLRHFGSLTAKDKATYLLRAIGKRSFPMAEYYNDSQARTVLAELAKNNYDVVVFQSSYILPIIKDIRELFSQAVFVMDAHNVESTLQYRMATSSRSFIKPIKKAMAKNLQEMEEKCGAYVDAIAAVSELELQWWQQHCPNSHAMLIANGVDVDYFKPSTQKVQENTLVFCGSMSYRPNEEACLWFYEQIWPLLQKELPRIAWNIVGKDPGPAVKNLASESIKVTGTVDDVRQWVGQASLSIVPLLSGGGTRLKILEAMSMAKVIVSTSLGAEGIIDSPGLFRVDQPQQFAQSIIDLLQGDLGHLGAQNRDTATNHYSWQSIATQMETLLKTAVAKRGAS